MRIFVRNGLLLLAMAMPAYSGGLTVCIVDGKKVFSDTPCERAKRDEKGIQEDMKAHAAADRQKLKRDIERAKRAASPETRAREAATAAAAEERAFDAGAEVPVAGVPIQIAAAHLAQGLVHGSQVKIQVMEFYANNGSFPRGNSELGIPPPPEWSVKALDSLQVIDGTIVLRYNEKTGVKGGQMRLVPDDRRPHLGIIWNCVTPSYPEIASVMPDCKYERGR